MTRHLCSNFQLNEVSSATATGVVYVTLYRHEGRDEAEGPAPVVPPLGVLRHRDRLARDDEVWKFKRKTSRAIMTDRERVTHYDK